MAFQTLQLDRLFFLQHLLGIQGNLGAENNWMPSWKGDARGRREKRKGTVRVAPMLIAHIMVQRTFIAT